MYRTPFCRCTFFKVSKVGERSMACHDDKSVSREVGPRYGGRTAGAVCAQIHSTI